MARVPPVIQASGVILLVFMVAAYFAASYPAMQRGFIAAGVAALVVMNWPLLIAGLGLILEPLVRLTRRLDSP